MVNRNNKKIIIKNYSNQNYKNQKLKLIFFVFLIILNHKIMKFKKNCIRKYELLNILNKILDIKNKKKYLY